MTNISENLRTWAEINPATLAHNIHALRRRLGHETRLMAVVKADAYGHGTGLVAPTCVENGVTDFGVATAAEGVALRGLVPAEADIYLLGPTLPGEAPDIVAHRLTPFLSSAAAGRALSEAARRQGHIVSVHLDVDTGMGRSGVAAADAPALLAVLDSLPSLRVTGLTTHFARADEDTEDTEAQHRLFTRLIDELGARAASLTIHAANSPALLALPTVVQHHLARPGLLLYGIEPAPGLFTPGEFRPVLSWKARVTLCRPLPGGATVSYGRTYTVPAEGGSYATLGVGYGDGYSRRLSNVGHVLLHGRRAPICGRVCMDQMVVDVTGIPGVQAGDTATLIGQDGEDAITVGDLAAVLGTTPHEITTCLTARVPRIPVSFP